MLVMAMTRHNPEESALDLVLVVVLVLGGLALVQRWRQASSTNTLSDLLSQGAAIIAANEQRTSVPGGSSFYQPGFGYGGPAYNT